MQQENQVVFLKQDDMVLRPFTEADIPHLVRWANDPNVTRYINLYLPMTAEDEKEWLEGVRKNKQTDVVLLITVEDGKPIGNLGLHGISWRDRNATLGIFIGEQDYWGKGHGSRAILLLLKYAFMTLNLRKVHLSVLGSNGRAQAAYKKCGFVEEGCYREHIFRNGVYVDLLQMAVFKKTWLESQK